MRLIIDTDPGIDDTLAILYLAACAEVEVVAVGSAHGNVSSAQAATNALWVLAQAGLDQVPVAVGAARPLAQPLATAEFVHGSDGLGGHGGQASSRPVDISAAEQIVALARANPGELTLLALAPLTNLALATLLEPRLPALLRSVVVMGGALGIPGNITAYAEANFYHDPEAADLVLGAGFELTLVGLNVTEQAAAGPDWLAALADLDHPRARLAGTLLKHYVQVYSTLYGRESCLLHDPLAAAIAVDPALATYRTLPLAVELAGHTTRGALIADLRGLAGADELLSPIADDRRAVRVARTANIPVFLDRMLAALRYPPIG